MLPNAGMSICSFYPMKKRKLCKTPNGPATRRRTSGSTLGKLKKSSDWSAPSDNGIEILWDNNSPSPTTTIALAGKRRRRQNASRSDENGVTDLSFVVQKFSEITSPVVDQGHSALLEMWINKDPKSDNVHDEEFTSPPFETRHQKTNSPRCTPLIQRPISRRRSRKATREFMLEIRKLVDEIQKSDLSGSSGQSQKDSKITKDQALVTRPKTTGESLTKITPVKQSLTDAKQPCKATSSVPGTTNFNRLLEDSFEWTEDDMDELILTCQLSSSGKGSLSFPEPPGPQFGFSPSEIMLVPETQALSHAEKTESHTKQAEPCEHAQEVPEHINVDKWAMNSDEDDLLLAAAVQEYELSQEALTERKNSPKKESKCENHGENHSFLDELLSEDKSKEYLSHNENPIKISPSKRDDPNEVAGKMTNFGKPVNVQTTQTKSKTSLKKETSERRSNKNTPDFSLGGICSMATQRTKSMLHLKRNTPSGNKAGTSLEDHTRSNENHYPRNNVRAQQRANEGTASPLKSIPGNSAYPEKRSRLQTNSEKSKNRGVSACAMESTAKYCSSMDKNIKECKLDLIQGKKGEENEFDYLLCEDNFAALLDDINFDEVLTNAISQAPVSSTKTSSKSCANNSAPTSRTTSEKKATYSKDEIERKRVEAQRRLLAKQKNTVQRNNVKISKR